MCFFAQLDVELQRNTPTTRAAFELPDSGSWRFAGRFPSWQLIKGGCSCDLVDSHGRGIRLETPVLRDLLADANVKCIHLIWYWSDEPEAPPEVRLDIDEFEALNTAETLAPGTRYRINNPSKYARAWG